MTKCSEAERQARREADRRKSQAAVEALKTSVGWQRWLASRRHFHEYSLTNQLLIAVQCAYASRVAGFQAWLKLGYCVRRGERALRIWMPMPPSRRELEQWRKGGSPEGARPRIRFRLGPVFDRSQVEELPPPATPLPLDPPVAAVEGEELGWALPPLHELAGHLGCTVIVHSLPDAVGGYFEPERKVIALNAGRSINHQVKTLVHELGHVLLRQQPTGSNTGFSYSEEELVVESVAFTVCGSLGLDTSGFSIPYLASWSEQASLETIERAARVIDEIAKRIEVPVTAAVRSMGPASDELEMEAR